MVLTKDSSEHSRVNGECAWGEYTTGLNLTYTERG